MKVFSRDGKNKKEIIEDNVIYIKTNGGIKFKISEDVKDELTIFSIDEREVVFIQASGPRRIVLKSLKTWIS